MHTTAAVPRNGASDTGASHHRPIRARTYLIGALLTALYAFLAPYSLYSLFSCRLDQGMLPVGVLLLFSVVLAANLLVSRSSPVSALRVWELAVVFGMMWVGAAALQIGILHNSLGVMSAPEYFASPENRWDEYYLPHIPVWTIPGDRTGAVRMFYNGAPAGTAIPWEAWLIPLFWWGSFLAALLGAIVSLMAVVHEQWHEHEKLTFPMAEIGLAMVGHEENGNWQATWMRSRGFWIAAAIPFLILVWNSLNWFSTSFPRIGITQDPSEINVRYLPIIATRLDPFVLGIAYFAPVQILRGMWLGFLIIGAEIGLGQKFGFAEGMNPGFEPWSDWGTQTTAWQCLGSIVLWVLWGFWVGREHFRRVINSGLGRPTGLPERLRRRYRGAFWGFIVAVSYLAFWFHALGMEWPVVVLFLPMVFILALGIAKTIAVGSFMQVEGPVSAQTFVMQTMGTAFISQASMAALVLSYVTFRSSNGIMMAQVAFASRMSDAKGASRRNLYLGIGISVFAVLAVGTVTMIYLGYDVGAFNFGSHAFRVGHIEAYDTLRLKKEEAITTDWLRVGFFVGGMALMGFILLMRTWFAGFWLHPVGFTYATSAAASITVMNIFLAWLAKLALLKLGGHQLADRAQRVFLGLICGHTLGVGYGTLIDAIFFPGSGHPIVTGW